MSGFLFEKSVMSVQFIQMCFQELSSTTYFCLSVILVFECNSAKKSICSTQAIIATYVLKLFFIASKVVCRVTANNSTRSHLSHPQKKGRTAFFRTICEMERLSSKSSIILKQYILFLQCNVQ